MEYLRIVSKRMISKILPFVMLMMAIQFSGGCSAASSIPVTNPVDSPFESPRVIGAIRSPDITESSGLAASRCQQGVYWTHNDSGDDPLIYAIDRSGSHLGTWRVAGAENIDWEDIATQEVGDKCFLYIGEIGDNKMKRPEHRIYRIEEPLAGPDLKSSSRREPLMTAPSVWLEFRYPDENQDAETLLIHPATGDIYVITKRVSGPAGVYLIKNHFGRSGQTARRIGELSVPAVPNGFLTGGDISPDGRRMLICDYTQAYEYELPAGNDDWTTIFRQTPLAIALGKRRYGEAITYDWDGRSIIATSEGTAAPIIEVRRKQYE